eukprot:2577552-Alexandrium_andersonii.AAC.1
MAPADTTSGRAARGAGVQPPPRGTGECGLGRAPWPSRHAGATPPRCPPCARARSSARPWLGRGLREPGPRCTEWPRPRTPPWPSASPAASASAPHRWSGPSGRCGRAERPAGPRPRA